MPDALASENVVHGPHCEEYAKACPVCIAEFARWKASPASEDVVEPFAWTFELANARTYDYESGKPHGWTDWGKPQLSFTKPRVPVGAIRNLRPLYVTSPTPRDTLEEALELIKSGRPCDPQMVAIEALAALNTAQQSEDRETEPDEIVQGTWIGPKNRETDREALLRIAETLDGPCLEDVCRLKRIAEGLKGYE